MIIEKMTDREEIEAVLMRDRLANAYLLGNLDPQYYPFCKWHALRDSKGEVQGICLLYIGLSLPVVFVSCKDEHFPTLMRECSQELPSRFHFHVLEDEMTNVAGAFEPRTSQRMHRMGLERTNYKPLAKPKFEAERLGHRDTAAIMELYQHYPDNFFEPYQLETGLYFGVRDEELGLSSIAGIHVFSEEHDVAVIGNFVTHPDRRGQGLASACTARLLDALFGRVSFVALNVQEDNVPAIKMYSNFGFEKNNIFFEGRVGEP